MDNLDYLYEKLEGLRGRRGISPVKIGQLIELIQTKLGSGDVVYVRAKDLAKDSIHFNDPRYVGVCLSMLKDVTPDKRLPFDVEKYSKSWRIARASPQ